jgi:hypothetical protein
MLASRLGVICSQGRPFLISHPCTHRRYVFVADLNHIVIQYLQGTQSSDRQSAAIEANVTKVMFAPTIDDETEILSRDKKPEVRGY